MYTWAALENESSGPFHLCSLWSNIQTYKFVFITESTECHVPMPLFCLEEKILILFVLNTYILKCFKGTTNTR